MGLAPIFTNNLLGSAAQLLQSENLVNQPADCPANQRLRYAPNVNYSADNERRRRFANQTHAASYQVRAG